MDNLIGKTLDGLYTVRELIGTGGMANVYKAVVGPGGPVPEGTVVAVKVLRQELMHDPDLVRRFKNESKAISLLNHPNIVKVYDVSHHWQTGQRNHGRSRNLQRIYRRAL